MNLKIKSFFVFLLFLFSSSLFALDVTQKGQLSAEFTRFNNDANSDTQDQHFGGLIHPELTLLKDDWRNRFRFYYRFDTSDAQREFFNVEDLWVEKSDDDWSMRMGMQTFSFSVLDYFHASDVLNSYDFDTPLERRDKKGELAITFNKKLPWGACEFYLMPLKEKNHYGGKRSRYGLKQEVGNTIWEKDRHWVQWGAALKTMIASADLDFYLIHHMDRKNPLLEEYGSEKMLIPHHYPAWVGGVTYQQELDSTFVLKGEWVMKKFENNAHSLPTVMGQRKRDSFDILALAIEKKIFHLGGAESKVILEHQSYWGTGRRDKAELDPFQNDLLLAIKHARNNSFEQELSAFIIYDLERSRELYLGADYEQFIAQFWKVHFLAAAIETKEKGKSKGDGKGLKFYSGDKRAEVTLTRIF